MGSRSGICMQGDCFVPCRDNQPTSAVFRESFLKEDPCFTAPYVIQNDKNVPKLELLRDINPSTAGKVPTHFIVIIDPLSKCCLSYTTHSNDRDCTPFKPYFDELDQRICVLM